MLWDSLEAPQPICFCREIRKILCGYPLLSVAMGYPVNTFYAPAIRRMLEGAYSATPVRLSASGVSHLRFKFFWREHLRPLDPFLVLLLFTKTYVVQTV